MPGLTCWTQEKDDRHPLSQGGGQRTNQREKIISVGLITLGNLPNLDHAIWLRPGF